jgi:metal-dependent amidase/aminoacylase/carboxypeptidase family protein
MLRAEMDALPVKEDTGLPYWLSKNLNFWQGTLLAIFQPAVETGEGAKSILSGFVVNILTLGIK